MMSLAGSCPILTCEEAGSLETRLLAHDESREWAAMQRAGRAIALAVLQDAREIGGFRANARMLVLVGKGHNGGDALIAARAILETLPEATAKVVFVFGERALRPLAARAWRELAQAAGARVRSSGRVASELGEEGSRASPGEHAVHYELCLDGVFGFQFRPPAESRVAGLLHAVNRIPIRLRAAVDLPSAGLFRADFTYATGSVKIPVLNAIEAGRVRYLDLGFFNGDEAGESRVLTSAVLRRLAELRPAHGDKRSYGHLFVVGGSRSFPGAILMTVLAALRSGVGLVTACVPETIMPAFAARAPEAMWIGWPETPAGGLALEGEHLLRGRIGRATALVLGPGLGREPETLALAAGMVKTSTVPLVIDADALQPEIVNAGSVPRILTPHAGELERIGGEAALRASAQPEKVMVLKGPVTRVAQGAMTYHSFFGGPVLARGGSGDVLAGLLGGLLAQVGEQTGDEGAEDRRRGTGDGSRERGDKGQRVGEGRGERGGLLLAAARGVVWHGMAADELARMHGQTPVCVTQLLDFLPAALKASAL